MHAGLHRGDLSLDVVDKYAAGSEFGTWSDAGGSSEGTLNKSVFALSGTGGGSIAVSDRLGGQVRERGTQVCIDQVCIPQVCTLQVCT